MSEKQPKLTPWFTRGQQPVRKGFYQRKYATSEAMDAPDFWDGDKWILYDTEGKRVCTAINQNTPWRGLAVKP